MDMMVHKVTLGSGKVVMIQDMQIKHEELAAKAVAKAAGENPALMAMLMQNEIIKMLIVSIDGKQITALDREQLSKMLTYGDFVQLRKVVAKLMGGDEADPKIELVSSTV